MQHGRKKTGIHSQAKSVKSQATWKKGRIVQHTLSSYQMRKKRKRTIIAKCVELQMHCASLVWGRNEDARGQHVGEVIEGIIPIFTYSLQTYRVYVSPSVWKINVHSGKTFMAQTVCTQDFVV